MPFCVHVGCCDVVGYFISVYVTMKLTCLQFLDNILILPISVNWLFEHCQLTHEQMTCKCNGSRVCKSKENRGKTIKLIWLLILNGHLY